MTSRHWGPHFPDSANTAVKHWSIHFPDTDRDPALLNAFGPGGVATFLLTMESGFTLRLEWITDIIKSRSGKEQRIATLDAPKQFFEGTAILSDDIPREIRGHLARFASLGATFLLGLPHEELTLVTNTAGTAVFVDEDALDRVDWANPGQRVAVARDGSFVEAVIQSAENGIIILDKVVGSVGNIAGRIMPTMPVLLDPQQDFIRYPTNVESWQFRARAAIFDYAPRIATLPLGPLTSSGALAGVTIVSRRYGLVGNTITFALSSGGPPGGIGTENNGHVQIAYAPGVTTLAQIKAILDTSSYVQMTGDWNDADTLTAGDAFLATALSGGTAGGNIGSGAALTTYETKPVWDRYIQVDGGAGDSIHSMVEIVDLGGIPRSVGTADMPDWGRHVMIRRQSMLEWQWLKLFLWTVRGRQKSFWIPSWRNDLVYVNYDDPTTTLTVSGDVLAWWPRQRQHLQILHTDASVTYAEVLTVTNNGDGTFDLGLSTALPVTSVAMLSWLELSRFERDDFDIVFNGPAFSMTTVARVVQQ